tara:strand:+ start:476 stop:673 length:198 start_codon:yes stop_codon:yes gene_type:complete
VLRRRAVAWVRAFKQWRTAVDREARWQARADGRDQPDADDAVRAVRTLRARGVEMPWIEDDESGG